MANVKVINSTTRQSSKCVASAASPNDVPKTRLFACSKMEVHKKEVDEKRLKLRQKYGKSTSKLETKPRTFVTKVQIKSKKPASKDDKIRIPVRDHTFPTPRSISAKLDDQSKQKLESKADQIPTKCATNFYPKNRLTAPSEDSIDLLWADEYSPEQEKQEYLEINKLVRYLSRRQRESSVLLYKIPQRPTASFARPTKGEISLWMKSPANKSNRKPFLTEQRDQDSIRPRSRAWSLPLYRFPSPSVENVQFEQSKCLEIGRPSSVPIKQIPPR